MYLRLRLSHLLFTATTVIIAAKTGEQDVPDNYITAITALFVATTVTLTTATAQKQKQNNKGTAVTASATASVIPHTGFLL